MYLKSLKSKRRCGNATVLTIPNVEREEEVKCVIKRTK